MNIIEINYISSSDSTGPIRSDMWGHDPTLTLDQVDCGEEEVCKNFPSTFKDFSLQTPNHIPINYVYLIPVFVILLDVMSRFLIRFNTRNLAINLMWAGQNMIGSWQQALLPLATDRSRYKQDSCKCLDRRRDKSNVIQSNAVQCHHDLSVISQWFKCTFFNSAWKIQYVLFGPKRNSRFIIGLHFKFNRHLKVLNL